LHVYLQFNNEEEITRNLIISDDLLAQKNEKVRGRGGYMGYGI
jgi:hypothetical protein